MSKLVLMQQQAAIYCQCTGDIMDIVDEWQKAEEQKVSHFAEELYQNATLKRGTTTWIVDSRSI